MRTDVKIGLAALVVLILLVVGYFAMVPRGRKTSNENATPVQQPSLTTTHSVHKSHHHHSAGSGGNPVADLNGGNGNSNAGGGGNGSGGGAKVPPPSILAGGGNGGVSPRGNNTGATTGNTGGNGAGLPLNHARPARVALQLNNPPSPPAGGSGAGNGNMSAGGSNGQLSAIQNTSGSASRHQGRTSGKMPIYTVRRHDTLSSIARRIYHNGSRRVLLAIERANPGMHPNTIHPGQKLRLPGLPAGVTHSRTARTRHRSTGRSMGGGAGRWYTVHRHDSLLSIARHFYHSNAAWKRIYRANRSRIGSNPSDLRVGERLLLPGR